MKYFILFILAGFIYGQDSTIFEAEVFFDVPEGDPLLVYDNSGFVEYFRSLPVDWKEDLFSQNLIAKKQGYFELILKDTEWLYIPIEDQQLGLTVFEVVKDPNFFAHAFLVMPFDTLGKDTNIVDFDSVSITTYFYGIVLEPDTTFTTIVTEDTTIFDTTVVFVTVLPDKKPKKEKFKKKQNGDIDYPTNLVNFPSKADRKIYLKEQKKIKKEKKDK